MEALARAMIVSSRERMRAPLKDGGAPDEPEMPDGEEEDISSRDSQVQRP